MVDVSESLQILYFVWIYNSRKINILVLLHWSYYQNNEFININSTYIHLGWLNTTLYTRVLVNLTNMMKMHPFCGAHFSVNILEKIIPLHPLHFQNYIGIIKKRSMSVKKRAPPFCQFYFWFGSNSKYIIISL